MPLEVDEEAVVQEVRAAMGVGPPAAQPEDEEELELDATLESAESTSVSAVVLGA